MNKLGIRIAIMCLLVGIATAAFAVPPSEVVRVQGNQTFTGTCCFPWGETITVTEPRVVVPVVVTWSTDYLTTAGNVVFEVGVSVNGHPCLNRGTLNEFVSPDGTATSATFQWLISPSDGLIKGTNNITLCGGSASGGSITIGFNTLAARMSK